MEAQQSPGSETPSILLLCFPQYAACILWPKLVAPAPIITSHIPVCRKEERGRAGHVPFLYRNDWDISHITLLMSHWPEYSSIAIPSLSGFSMSSQPILSWDLPSQGSSGVLVPTCQSHSLMVWFLRLTAALENEWNHEESSQQGVGGIQL